MIVYIGIDWSKDKHDIVFMNEQGGHILHLSIAHTPQGFERFNSEREKLGFGVEECIVGIETHHNLILDYLNSRGYQRIYVLPPFKVNRSRGRHAVSGASSDKRDAGVIADMLRTDHKRLTAWKPSQVLTQQIASRVSLQRFLSRSIIQVTNRLRTALWRYYPNASRIFSRLDAQIALQFIMAYPTPEHAIQLSYQAFQHFAKQHRYPNPKKLPACFARLQQPQPQADPATVLAFREEAVRLSKLALQLVYERIATEDEIRKLFAVHPDAFIFASLPGVGDRLAPALLTKFGDDRQRYPTANILQSVAGTCPYTKQSGKRKRVLFRQACDRQFRHITQQWARASLDQSVWANSYFHMVRPRCKSISHAYRCLANRWLAVAWRIWQDSVPYDENLHLRNHALRVKPI
jgi:transposase